MSSLTSFLLDKVKTKWGESRGVDKPFKSNRLSSGYLAHFWEFVSRLFEALECRNRYLMAMTLGTSRIWVELVSGTISVLVWIAVPSVKCPSQSRKTLPIFATDTSWKEHVYGEILVWKCLITKKGTYIYTLALLCFCPRERGEIQNTTLFCIYILPPELNKNKGYQREGEEGKLKIRKHILWLQHNSEWD